LAILSIRKDFVMRKIGIVTLALASVIWGGANVWAATKNVAIVGCNLASDNTFAIDTTVSGAPAVGGSCAGALQFFRNAGLKFINSTVSGSTVVYTLSN